MEYPCGGNGICGKCVIRFVRGEAPEPNDVEKRRFTGEELAMGYRLACQTKQEAGSYVEVCQEDPLQGNIVSEATEQQTFSGADDRKTGRGGAAGQRIKKDGTADGEKEESYGVAVDLGTTTIAMALVDRKEKRVLATHTLANLQKKYGADVMSRMQFANEGGGRKLRDCCLKALGEGLQALTAGMGERRRSVSRMVIAGNTTMYHLMLGLSCEALAAAPFRPVTLEPEDTVFQGIPVSFVPGASAFIGGDILAGLLALDALSWKEPRLFLDLGTNGEMVLGNEGGFVAASAAAGPALEGGNISCGVPGIYGAVCDVIVAGERNQTVTIGGVPAIGICGSGLLAALAGMKRQNILNRHWTLKEPYLTQGYPLFAPGASGNIVLTQEDVRQFVMAKSAIAAGYQLLLKEKGMTEADLKEVILAGGLGVHLKVSAGVETGLLSRGFSGKTKSAGNTSLQGAVAYLLQPKKSRESIRAIRHKMQMIPLAGHPDFQEQFLKNMETP